MIEEDLSARVDLQSLASVDRDRFNAFVAAHLDFVWRTIRRLGLSPSEADDASQQVFLVVARRLDAIAPDAERSFLYRSAVNTVRNARRARVRRPEDSKAEVEMCDPGPNPEQTTERREARKLLDEILDEMDDDPREVFVLFELEATPLAEIAALLELPEGTCASRLRRAREQFEASAKRMRARETFTRRQP